MSVFGFKYLYAHEDDVSLAETLLNSMSLVFRKRDSHFIAVTEFILSNCADEEFISLSAEVETNDTYSRLYPSVNQQTAIPSVDASNVNITAQDLAQVRMRHIFGGVESSASPTVTINPNTTTTAHSYTGSGYFYNVLMTVAAAPGSHYVYPQLFVDGTRIRPNWGYSGYSLHDFTDNTTPIALMKYAVDGFCVLSWFFNPPLYFSTSIAFKFKEVSGNSYQGNAHYFYTQL